MTRDEHTAALADFGILVFNAHREHLGDLDGAWLQDAAEACGLLVWVTVPEPCGDSCRCAEYYDEAPYQCLREVEVSDTVYMRVKDGVSGSVGSGEIINWRVIQPSCTSAKG